MIDLAYILGGMLLIICSDSPVVFNNWYNTDIKQSEWGTN